MKRRHTIALLLLLLLVTPPVFAENQTDSSSAAIGRQNRNGEKFVDQDGDGIDDGLAGRAKGFQRGKDRFIDRDGDGICDDRATGLGYRRGSTGAGPSLSGDSKGKRQGQGGKP